MLILFWLSQTWPVTLRIQEYVFSGSIVPPDCKETELGSSNQEATPSVEKYTRINLVPSSCMEVHPYSYFWWCGYFWGPWVSFVKADEFSVRITKTTSTIGASWTHSLPFYFFSQFNLNELWPYYQKYVNQIILNLTTLYSLALQKCEAFIRILLIEKLSLNQPLLTLMLYVRQTWMTQLILAISPWEVIFL